MSRQLSPKTRAPQKTLPPIPGFLSASGDLGSLFGRGYDPMEQKPRAPIAQFHYDKWACKETGSGCSNVWTDPSSGMQFGRPDEVQIFHTAAAHTDSSNHLFVTTEDYEKWHWSQHSTSINLGVFSFSHSQVKSYVSELLDTQRAVIAINRQVTAYKMAIRMPLCSLQMSRQDPHGGYLKQATR